MRDFRLLQTKACRALLIVGAAMFLISAKSIHEYKNDARISDDANAQAIAIAARSANKPVAPKEILQEDDLDIAAMQQVNPDTRGILKLQGQALPVVCSDNNARYLATSWNGEKTSCGAIFMDEASDEKNIILYGHHMRNGKMFGELEEYLSKEYKNEHPSFKWITDEAVDTYQVVAVIRADASELKERLSLNLENDYEALSAKASDTGMLYEALTMDNSYMSLITCEYSGKDGRLALIGKRTESLERK